MSAVSIVTLVLASVLTVLFIVMMIKGKSSDYMIETLDDDTFQLKELYAVGFGWSSVLPPLAYGSELSNKIKQSVTILYGEKYSEYYTRLYLAKIATFAHLIAAVLAAVGALVSGAVGLFLAIIGIVVGIVIGKVYVDEPKKNVEEQANECVIEFPNLVTEIALLLNAGITLREAWFIAAQNTKGRLQELMNHSCELMQNGVFDQDAIYDFGVHSGSDEIRKFAMMMIQSIERGNAELASVMMQQSAELWEIKKQKLLQKGEQAATKLVIPTSLMFVGVILVVLSSAIAGMSLGL